MKYASLISMIVLSSAAAIGCGQDEAGSANANGSGATGGAGPTGGTGGGSLGEGACTTADNVAVYDELDYTNTDGEDSTGTDAASAIAADCLGELDVDVVGSVGCVTEFAALIAVISNPTQEVIDALVECDETCLRDVTRTITGTDGLTVDCAACYGDSVACGATNCTAACSADPTADVCVQCREDTGCTPNFRTCSGIP